MGRPSIRYNPLPTKLHSLNEVWDDARELMDFLKKNDGGLGN